MNRIEGWGTIFFGGIITVAVISTLVKNKNSIALVQAGGTATSGVLSAAEGNG
jgi:hypothetical protein